MTLVETDLVTRRSLPDKSVTYRKRHSNSDLLPPFDIFPRSFALLCNFCETAIHTYISLPTHKASLWDSRLLYWEPRSSISTLARVNVRYGPLLLGRAVGRLHFWQLLSCQCALRVQHWPIRSTRIVGARGRNSSRDPCNSLTSRTDSHGAL